MTVTSAACLCMLLYAKDHGAKGKEMSLDLKKVTADLFKNGEKMSDIARLLQQPRPTISEDLEKLVQWRIVRDQEYNPSWTTGTTGSWRKL